MAILTVEGNAMPSETVLTEDKHLQDGKQRSDSSKKGLLGAHACKCQSSTKSKSDLQVVLK